MIESNPIKTMHQSHGDLVGASFETLCHSSLFDLEQRFRRGALPRPAVLMGWEFRGYNVNLGAELIRGRKFKKGFHADPTNPALLRGFNVRVKQNGLLNPWVEKLRKGEPIREIPFLVYPVRDDDRDNLHLNSLLINYDTGSKLPLDPSRLLRDYLVQLTVENNDLFLGKTYGAVGSLRVPLSFFVLERHNKI